MLEHGQLKTQPLVSERIAFSEAAASYQQLLMAERSLGIAFHYDTPSSHVGDGPKPSASRSAPPSDLSRIPTPRIGVIGAGQFSSTVLCPSLAKLPVTMTALCSSRGAEASALAKRYRFDVLSADSEALLASPLIDVAFITTRHHSHARLASLALKSGKNVFVEKPLALSLEELRDVTSVARASPSLRLMVGFNRRFSPLSVKAREVLALSPEPRAITITVNAGKLDPGHWLHDREIGGGRLLGEGCHFIDLALFFAGSRAISAYACATRGGVHDSLADVCSVQLQCENGSIATILYLANGSRELPKERVEIFSAGRVLVIDNFRELRTFGATPPTRLRLKGQDKGHDAELMQFISAISTGGPSPLSLEDLEASTRATLAAHQSLLSGRVVAIPQEGEAFTQTSIQPQRLNVADHS